MKIKFVIIFLILFFEIAQSNSTISKKIELIDKSKLTQIIKTRNGRILLLNIWATWCIPCREEFPDLVKLNSIYKNTIEIIGISVDDIDDSEKKVLPFLNNNNVDFKNFISSFKKEEDLINILNIEWNGALPATFIFDVNGKQIKMLNGKQSYLDIKNLLDDILKK
ncbi:MAG: TlpA family protein disulfide reductase [Ignavibacteriae bacterium]|nr:TlpA family protein disulfide reductase [Ignavibacteriota bacterium]